MSHKRYRVLRQAPKPPTPVQALELSEDMERFETIIGLLRKVNATSISKDKENAWKQLWSVRETVRFWQAYARERMRKEFLSV